MTLLPHCCVSLTLQTWNPSNCEWAAKNDGTPTQVCVCVLVRACACLCVRVHWVPVSLERFGTGSHRLDPIKTKWQTNAAQMVICLQQYCNVLTASWGIFIRWDHWTDSWLEAEGGVWGCRLNATCGLQTVWFWYSSLSLLSLLLLSRLCITASSNSKQTFSSCLFYFFFFSVQMQSSSSRPLVAMLK